MTSFAQSNQAGKCPMYNLLPFFNQFLEQLRIFVSKKRVP